MKLSSLLLLAVILLAPAVASADDADRARELYERGSAQYEAGDYVSAARSLRQAYDLVQRPALLYNIGMAEWRAGQEERAIETFERALNLELPANLVPPTEARLAGIAVTLNARTAAADIAGQVAAQPPASVPASDPDDSWGWKGWTGTAATVAGAGLLAGAGFVSLQIAENETDLRAAAAANDARLYDQLQAEIDDQQTVGPVLLYSGAGLVAAGLGLLMWELFDDQSSEASAGVVATPDGAAGSVTIRF